MKPDDYLLSMRSQTPLVHSITNYVAMNFAANALLAAGASPAMVHATEEVADFAIAAKGLSINIGTLSAHWAEAMIKAAKAAHQHQTPWVLDPVAHFISPFRSQTTRALLAQGPAIIRGNASELLALAGRDFSARGADTGDDVAAAEEAAGELALQTGAVVAVTGAYDFVTDGTNTARVLGGSPLMPKVTAIGCAQGALMAAYAATGPAFGAALAGLAHFKVAGGRAGAIAAGPGSFQQHFLDALAMTQVGDLQQVIS